MASKIAYRFERYEKKYFVTPVQQQALLERLGERLAPDEFGNYAIGNLYYDTPDWRLVRTSLGKPAYKEKLRVRSYGVPGPQDEVFLELKKKYAGVVYKRRVSCPAEDAEPFLRGELPGLDGGQVGKELLWFQQIYHAVPKVFIGYDRTAFFAPEETEVRVTFDQNLRWRDTELDLCKGDFGAPILPDDRILMEVKIPGACPLWLSHVLSELEIFPVSFSKYGTCYREHILKRIVTQQEELEALRYA